MLNEKFKCLEGWVARLARKIKMNKSKGFTIIELIVVIAIIAILAAIVMVNVTQYIAKSKDASIQANMDAIKTNAAAFMADVDKDGTMTTFITTTEYSVPLAAIELTNGTATVTSLNDAAHFCVSSPLPSAPTTKEWCVDDTGYAGDATCTAVTFECT